MLQLALMFCSEAAVAGAGRVALSVLLLETVLSSVPSCGTTRCSTWLVNNINSALLTKKNTITELSVIFCSKT